MVHFKWRIYSSVGLNVLVSGYMIVINLISYTYVVEVREWVNCEVECLHPNTVGVNYQAGMAAILIWCDTEIDNIRT